MKQILLVCLLFGFTGSLFAQDSINVTFRYSANSAVERIFVPGEFNNWGPNNNGVIAVGAPSLMTNADGTWFKTIRLKVGGGATTIDGKKVYQYKIHEHLNSTGSSYNWLPDPINPNKNSADNNNSYFTVTHPLIFQIEPLNGQIVRNDQPGITATVASTDKDPIDTEQSQIFINDQLAGEFGVNYNKTKQMFILSSLYP